MQGAGPRRCFPSLWPIYRDRVSAIVANLDEAGLVSKKGEKIEPTDLIIKVQKALQISLTDLSSASRGPESLEIVIEPSVIDELRKSRNNKYDLAKVVRFCEELNSSFSNGNCLASTLLIRAPLNHIPPIFGHTTFQQVVSQAPRSVKELLKPLKEVARDVADHHTHSLIRQKECLPTKSQVEAFKPSLEVLVHEVIVKVQEPGDN